LGPEKGSHQTASSANEFRSPEPMDARRDRLDDLWHQKRQAQHAPDGTHADGFAVSDFVD